MYSTDQINYIVNILGVKEIITPETKKSMDQCSESSILVNEEGLGQPMAILDQKSATMKITGSLQAPLIVLTAKIENLEVQVLLNNMMKAIEFDSFLQIEVDTKSKIELSEFLPSTEAKLGLIFGRTPGVVLLDKETDDQQLKPGKYLSAKGKPWMLTYALETMIPGLYDTSDKNLVMYKKRVWEHLKAFKVQSQSS